MKFVLLFVCFLQLPDRKLLLNAFWLQLWPHERETDVAQVARLGLISRRACVCVAYTCACMNACGACLLALVEVIWLFLRIVVACVISMRVHLAVLLAYVD